MKRLIDYLEALTVTQGRLAGQPFNVLPWQRKFVNHAFRKGTQSAALSVARGNGKTALLSGIAAATLDGPLMVPRSETVIVASSFEQGRIAFEHILAFLRPRMEKSPGDWRVWDTANQARIEYRESGAKVKCLGSDPRRAHGLAPVLVLADEPAQWPETTGERMVAALLTAAGKQPHSRFVSLGTRPADESHWFSKQLQGGADYAQCHAAMAEDPKFQKRTWKKANPSLDHMPDLLHALKTEAKQAKVDPALLAAFDALRLNLGTADTEASLLLAAGTWEGIEGEAERRGHCVWGLDLGTSAAQSAVTAYWPESGRLECFAAFPCVPNLAERGLRDGVGSLYVQCASENDLLTIGQNAVEIPGLLQEALKRFGRPSLIVADRWREAELRDALTAAGVPVAMLELRGMGFKDGAEDVRAFQRAVADGRVTPIKSLLLRSAISEARTVSDPAGNSKLSKATQGGRRKRARDDAAAAAILAVSAGVRQPERPRGGVRYVGMVG